MSQPIKIGDPVTGTCQDVGRLFTSMLGLDKSSDLKHVTGTGDEAPGELFLSGRKKTYQSDFAGKGLTTCDDGPQPFAKALTLLRLRLKTGGGAYIVGPNVAPTHYLPDGSPDAKFQGVAVPGVLAAVCTQDGKLLVADSPEPASLTAVRFGLDGSIDRTFVLDFRAPDDPSSNTTMNFNCLGVRPDGSGAFAAQGLNNATFGEDVFTSSDAGVVTDGNTFVTGIGMAYLSGGGFAVISPGHFIFVFSAGGSFVRFINAPALGVNNTLSVCGQSDGKFLCASAGLGIVTLARLTTDGGVDFNTTLAGGNPGFATSVSVAIGSGQDQGGRPTGKVLVAALYAGSFDLAQFNADGGVDTTFGDMGILTGAAAGAGTFIAAQAP